MESNEQRKWIDSLSDEDISFIKRFVMESGSLKNMAKVYGITYPTLRLRLDRLISKIEIIDSNVEVSEFEQALRLKYADGKIDHETLKELLKLHRKDKGRK